MCTYIKGILNYIFLINLYSWRAILLVQKLVEARRIPLPLTSRMDIHVEPLHRDPFGRHEQQAPGIFTIYATFGESGYVAIFCKYNIFRKSCCIYGQRTLLTLIRFIRKIMCCM